MKTDFAWYGTQTFFGTEIKDAAYIQHSLRYSGFYHPHVWRWHGAMGRHHRWSFSYAKRRRIYSSFSRPFWSVYSPHLLWRTFTFFSSGTEYLSLRRISDDRIWPFILHIRDAPSVLVALCKRTSLFTIVVVSSTRLLRSCLTCPTNALSANIPGLLHLSLTTLSQY